MAEPINAPSAEPTVQPQDKTFTQAEVDTMIQRRLERERKKYPSEDEMTAFNNWKASHETEAQKQANIIKERDTAQSALTAAQTENEALKRQMYVMSKGLSGDQAEFISFKAAKMVNDKTTFEQAVDALMQTTQQPVKFDWSAAVGGGNDKNSPNAAMNDIIRNFRK